LGDSPEDTAGGPISGLFKSLTSLVATVVAITQTRVALAAAGTVAVAAVLVSGASSVP
jgi:hypothetical protein